MITVMMGIWLDDHDDLMITMMYLVIDILLTAQYVIYFDTLHQLHNHAIDWFRKLVVSLFPQMQQISVIKLSAQRPIRKHPIVIRF